MHGSSWILWELTRPIFYFSCNKRWSCKREDVTPFESSHRFRSHTYRLYIPRTQTTTVLIRKDLVLEDSTTKIEDKQVPGWYLMSFVFIFRLAHRKVCASTMWELDLPPLVLKCSRWDHSGSTEEPAASWHTNLSVEIPAIPRFVLAQTRWRAPRKWRGLFPPLKRWWICSQNKSNRENPQFSKNKKQFSTFQQMGFWTSCLDIPVFLGQQFPWKKIHNLKKNTSTHIFPWVLLEHIRISIRSVLRVLCFIWRWNRSFRCLSGFQQLGWWRILNSLAWMNLAKWTNISPT